MGVDTSCLLLGGIYSLGQVVYKTQESVQKAIILAGVPFIFIITLVFAKGLGLASLRRRSLGPGRGVQIFASALPIATFLGALAYAGAGGI